LDDLALGRDSKDRTYLGIALIKTAFMETALIKIALIKTAPIKIAACAISK